MIIDLPPQVEQVLLETAKAQGISPVQHIINLINQSQLSAEVSDNKTANRLGDTIAQRFAQIADNEFQPPSRDDMPRGL